MKVAKWGNSLAIRLPLDVVNALKLHEGADIELVAAEKHTIVVSKLQSPEEMLKQLRRFRGRVPKDFRFDRDEANARR